MKIGISNFQNINQAAYDLELDKYLNESCSELMNEKLEMRM